MTEVPGALASLALDCFLLARYASPGVDGRPDGRAWEQAVGDLMWRPGLARRQHAGTIGLFGSGAASGAGHEIDGAAHGSVGGVWIEAKARATITKSDVAVFDLKCADLYKAAVRHDPQRTRLAAWWPLVVSSEPVTEPARRLCMSLGIVLCDPERVPLPTLLRAAANPEADLYLPELLLSEAVRLYENICRPMQARWQISTAGDTLSLDLRREPTAAVLGDALNIQDELSADLLAYFDLEAPGQLAHRDAEVASRIRRRIGAIR
jgi:hypothetical protein